LRRFLTEFIRDNAALGDQMRRIIDPLRVNVNGEWW
jgi:hypothetical protein